MFMMSTVQALTQVHCGKAFWLCASARELGEGRLNGCTDSAAPMPRVVDDLETADCPSLRQVRWPMNSEEYHATPFCDRPWRASKSSTTARPFRAARSRRSGRGSTPPGCRRALMRPATAGCLRGRRRCANSAFLAGRRGDEIPCPRSGSSVDG